MSDDILNRIDETLARHRQRFDPLGGDVWDEDRVDRWGDGMRVRPARTGIEEESEQDEAAVEEPNGLDIDALVQAMRAPCESSEFYTSAPYRCRGCHVWMPLDVKLCGVCSELPPCAVRRSSAEWGGAAVCFRPVAHDGQHESVEGRCWLDPPPPVEAVRSTTAEATHCPRGCGYYTHIGGLMRLHEVACAAAPRVVERRPFLMAAIDAEREVFVERVEAALAELVVQPEPVSPLVDELLEPLDASMARLREAVAWSQAVVPPKPARLPWWKRWTR